MKKILCIAVCCALVFLSVYMEDKGYRGSLAAAGIVVLLCSLLKTARVQLRIVGALSFVLGALILFFVGVHGKQTGDRVELLSPLYFHSLGCYENVDTVELAGAYDVWYSLYSPRYSRFYILHCGDNDELWNKFRCIISVQGELKVEKKDLGHGELDVIRSEGKLYDLYGDEIQDGYHARTVDKTPPDIL